MFDVCKASCMPRDRVRCFVQARRGSDKADLAPVARLHFWQTSSLRLLVCLWTAPEYGSRPNQYS
jgi:hypothetical protein